MKKIFSIFLIGVFLFISTSSAHAAWTEPTLIDTARAKDIARGWDCPPPEDQQNPIPPDGDNPTANQEGWLASVFFGNLWNVSSVILGIGQTNCKEKQLAFFKQSAIGMSGDLIAGMYANPPASTSYYAYDLLQNSGFIPKVYAQGIGFSSLSPILPIWKVFRNISYMILLVVLIVVGFMIMFRAKINPQTVVTIQNALPNLVITLFLITFSYAIAGFMIDLIYFLLMLFIAVLHQGLGPEFFSDNLSQTQSEFLTGGFSTLLSKVFNTLPNSVEESGVPGGIGGFLAGAGASLVPALGISGIGIPLAIFLIVGGLIGGAVSSIAQGGGELGFLGGLVSPVLLLILSLALLFIFVRILFILISAYIQIILAIIFAPIQLLMGTIPGRNAFTSWFLGLLGNILVFPTVAALLILADVLTRKTAGLWTPPLLSGTVGSAVGGFTQSLIGFGMVMLIPSIVNAIKEAFKAKPILPITPGIVVSPILGSVQTAASSFMSFSYLKQGFGAVSEIFKPKPKP